MAEVSQGRVDRKRPLSRGRCGGVDGMRGFCEPRQCLRWRGSVGNGTCQVKKLAEKPARLVWLTVAAPSLTWLSDSVVCFISFPEVACCALVSLYATQLFDVYIYCSVPRLLTIWNNSLCAHCFLHWYFVRYLYSIDCCWCSLIVYKGKVLEGCVPPQP